MNATGLGTIELMMNGYIAFGPTSEGSSSIISSDGNGCFCLSPGFQPGFGGSTLRMPLASVYYDRSSQVLESMTTEKDQGCSSHVRAPAGRTKGEFLCTCVDVCFASAKQLQRPWQRARIQPTDQQTSQKITSSKPSSLIIAHQHCSISNFVTEDARRACV